MRRILQIAVFASVLLAAAATAHASKQPKPPKLAPHAHIASLTAVQAASVFQTYIQNPECGRGSWSCDWKYNPAAKCYTGYSRWDCNGGVEQRKTFWEPWPVWHYRGCSVTGYVKGGVAYKTDNSCF